jgi:hypothetical protein
LVLSVDAVAMLIARYSAATASEPFKFKMDEGVKFLANIAADSHCGFSCGLGPNGLQSRTVMLACQSVQKC